MRGGSVRLTQAVRLAACGKEPEEKLSERKRQTRVIFSSWHRKPKEQRRDRRLREQRWHEKTI